MNHYTKLIPVVAGLLVIPATQLYALDGSKNTSSLINSTTPSFETLSTAKMQKMYLLNDTKVFTSNSTVSAVLETQLRGTQVSVMTVDGDMAQVLTQTGVVGYVSVDMLTSQKEYIFVPENVTMYTADSVGLKSAPSDKVADVQTVEKNQELQVTGSNEEKYWRVVMDNVTYYVDHEQFSSTKAVTAQASAAVSYTATVSAWNGAALNPSAGTISGPSGKETYYNLDMSGVVNIMRAAGNTDAYTVRADGVKMLGNYVMVAADLSIRPRGSLVQTSLGMGIVVDTGGFIYSNPTQLDIAVAW